MDTPRAIVTHLLTQPLSLAGLGSATGSSLPTLRRAIRDLQEARWVSIVGREVDTGGRPANLFGVDADAIALIGVHVEHPGMRLVATDLTGAVLDERELPGDGILELDTVDRAIGSYLEHVRARFPGRRVLGLALASPGYVDPLTGTVIAIGRVPTWNNLPMGERLREATGLRVSIVNDVDAMAAAEFGGRADPRTYAYLAVGEGVKFSLFLHGKPYVGPFGNAGLVNLRLLAAAGGDVDAADVLTMFGLVDTFLRRSASRRPPGADAHARVADAPDARARFLQVLALAEDGDPVAAELVGWMIDVLGVQIASFVHLIQPELLVIGGALAGGPERVLDDVEASLRRHLPTLLDNNLIVRRARVVSASAAAIGATRVFLHRFLAQDGPPITSVMG
ncbi:MAG: ROK family protein [Trueperaceae bacterium]|nr:ROK family protein [Trueperaceae bacterium]